MPAGIIAALVLAAVLLCVAVGLWWVNRPIASDRAYARQTLPLFGSDAVIDAAPIFDEEPDGDDGPATRDGNVAATVGAPNADAVAAALGNERSGTTERRAQRFAPPPGVNPVSSMEAPRAPEWRPITASPRSFTTGNQTSSHAGGTSAAPQTRQAPAYAPATAPTPAPASAPAASTFEGQSLSFSIPTDGTLQFLPGRLEITAGKDTGREIRFVRFPGPEGSRVTFGRVDGPMYRHVQLHDPTVSRRHATMELAGANWTLTNLSTTNPVVFNERLLGEGEAQVLADGDRIEMGEVVFRYRAR